MYYILYSNTTNTSKSIPQQHPILIPFHSIPSHSIPSHPIPFHSIPTIRLTKIMLSQQQCHTDKLQVDQKTMSESCDDYSSSSSDSETSKRGRGRPKKIRTAEEIVALEESKTKGRGRPKKILTKEPETETESKPETEHEQYQESQIQALICDSIIGKQDVKTPQEVLMMEKKQEIYTRMLVAAEEYKTKWGL